MVDRVDHKTKNVCQTCANLDSRCFVCDMPVKEGYQQLPDGRYICERELKTVVTSESDAMAICKGLAST